MILNYDTSTLSFLHEYTGVTLTIPMQSCDPPPIARSSLLNLDGADGVDVPLVTSTRVVLHPRQLVQHVEVHLKAPLTLASDTVLLKQLPDLGPRHGILTQTITTKADHLSTPTGALPKFRLAVTYTGSRPLILKAGSPIALAEDAPCSLPALFEIPQTILESPELIHEFRILAAASGCSDSVSLLQWLDHKGTVPESDPIAPPKDPDFDNVSEFDYTEAAEVPETSADVLIAEEAPPPPVTDLYPHRDASHEEKLDYLPPASTMTDDEIWEKLRTSHIPQLFGDEALARLKALVFKFADIFRSGVKTGQQVSPTHDIYLKPDARVPASPPYGEGLGRTEIIRTHIRDMLANNVIRPSTSPFAAPVVLAKKHDGTWRFCVDYRKLNDITIRDSYPLPKIDETLDSLQGMTVLSVMDLLSGFWQIPMRDRDREKTAFVSSQGLYEFLVMPFGLTNSPPMFQRAMDKVLAGLKWVFCMVYIDDVIVFSKSVDEHLDHLKQVFSRLHDYNLKVKPSKCNFMHQELPFLGHIVTAKGILPDPKKLPNSTTGQHRRL